MSFLLWSNAVWGISTNWIVLALSCSLGNQMGQLPLRLRPANPLVQVNLQLSTQTIQNENLYSHPSPHSIINSIVIILMLTGMIATILLRALHKDIARYNTLGDEDGGQEDYGWKLVHADVFRPPQYPMALSVLVGNGAQLFLMTAVTLGG